MGDIERKPAKTISRGISLRYPLDLLPDGYHPQSSNVIAKQIGGLEPRNGTLAVNAFTYPAIHTLRRLNDPTNDSFARLIGAGASLYDSTSVVAIDTGYSGSPLSMIPFRPNQSPRPWMYISDSQRMRKVRTDRTNYGMGIVPPLVPPTFTRGAPNYTTAAAATATEVSGKADMFEAAAGWANSTNAGAIATPARFGAGNAISAGGILYDSGSTGWACVIPSTLDSNFMPGALIQFNKAGPVLETAKIRQVFEAVKNTSIASIIYDTGTTGLCSIVTVDQSNGIQPDHIVQLNGTENVRILSVTRGPDGKVSFRCLTLGTFAQGQGLTAAASFRVYLVNTFAAGDTLTGNTFQSTWTYASPGLGWLYTNLVGTPQNLTSIPPTTNGRPTYPSDYFHISIKVDKPGNVVGGRIILNTDAAFPAIPAASGILEIQNGLYKDFSPDVFQQSIDSKLTTFAAQQANLQRGAVDDLTVPPTGGLTSEERQQFFGLPPGSPLEEQQLFSVPAGVPVSGIDTTPLASPVSDQTVPGTSAWTELNFKVGEFSPLGSAQNRGLSTVTGIIIQLQVTANTVLLVDSMWIGGTYGPDSASLAPYYIYYRYRATSSGAISNPSPITRTPIDLQRERGVITPTASADTQVDKIDIFAIGGNLTAPKLIGTVPNTSTAFNYDSTDSANFLNETLEFDRYQPFPVTDLPRTGTCAVSGTSILRVGGADTFNTAWQAGSQIIIDGIPYTLYASPTSTTQAQLNENAGSFSIFAPATFLVPEATLGGQPVSAMWGPDPITGVMFGAVNSKEGGTLYWTNPNDPDSASDANNVQISSPSEQVQNGFMFDGRCYVMTVSKLYNCYPQNRVDPISGKSYLTYIPQEVPNGKGLFGVYAFDVGDCIWMVTDDGIYEYGGPEGGGLKSITDDSLYPLFSHKGEPGTLTNGFYPIDFTVPDAIRLYSTKDALYFIFKNTNVTYDCWMYDQTLPSPGWFYLTYPQSPRVIYEEEGKSLFSTLLGGGDGTLQFVGRNNNDNGAAISANITFRYLDMGDPRSTKAFGDTMIDYDPKGVILTVTPKFNNGSNSLASQTIDSTTGRKQVQFNMQLGEGYIARNEALTISWSSAIAAPILYEWEPSYAVKPELITLRATDWDDAGYPGAKFIQGLILEANTFDVNQPINIQADNGTNGLATVSASINARHNGQSEIAYSFAPFIAHELRLVPTNPLVPWSMFKVRYVFEPIPELTTNWKTEGTAHGMDGYKHLSPRVWIALISTQDVTFTIMVDGINYVLTVPSTGGLYMTQKIMLPVMKGLTFQYNLVESTAGFRLFLKDSKVGVKPWGSTGPYQMISIFGGDHNDGAKI